MSEPEFYDILIFCIVIIISFLLGLTLTLFAGGVSVITWLHVIGLVCSSLGGLGTFIALIFVVRQFNLMRQDLIISINAQLSSRLDNFNTFAVEHVEDFEKLNKPYEQNTPANHKLEHLCHLPLTFFEEIYKHHVRYKLLDTEDWDQWKVNMAYFVNKPYVRGCWPFINWRYSKTFREFINGLQT